MNDMQARIPAFAPDPPQIHKVDLPLFAIVLMQAEKTPQGLNPLPPWSSVVLL